MSTTLAENVANADCAIVTDDGIRILPAWKWLLVEERT